MGASNRRGLNINEDTGLPSIKKFEIETADGQTATLLYTDSGVWEYGEENIKNAFVAAVDEGRAFVLISEQDIALDVLTDFAEKNGFNHDDVQKNYLHTMFSEHLGDKLDGMSEEEKLAFWAEKLEGRSEASNHAVTHSNGLVVINVDEFEASTMFGLDRDAPLSRLFLLGHEFDHADNSGKHGRSPMGILKGETESDQAGLKAAQASGQNTDGLMEQILFYRSREAIIAVMGEEVTDGRSGWQKFFGAGLLDEFNHVTSATLTPEGEIIANVSKADLKVSLKDFREKITEHMIPAVQEDALQNVIDNFSIKRSGPALAIMEDLQEFVSDNNLEDRYQPFIDNFNEHITEIKENMGTMTPDEISEKIELAKAEMSGMFSAMKENDPKAFEKLLESGRTATIAFSQSFNRDGQSKSLNSALHKVLSEMEVNGAFKGDPIQQRIVDAYLKGPELKPDEFEAQTVKPADTPAQESDVQIPAAIETSTTPTSKI